MAKCKTKINIHKYVNKNMTYIFANIHATVKFIPLFLSKTLYKSFDYADFKVWLLNLLKSYDFAITAAILPLLHGANE